MKPLILSVAAAAVLAAVPVSAQTQLTLRQCIEMAYSQSNNIRRGELSVEQSKNELSTARYQRLPSVSAYVGQNFDFGRGLTVNNTYENKNTRNTSFSVSANMTLFSGFRITRNMEMQKLNLEAATADLEAAKDNLGINVASAYLQVLCAKEMAEAAHEQVGLSSEQLRLKVALRDNGKASDADVAQARSIVAQDEMNAVTADNDYNLALLDLSQLLEMETPEGLIVSAPAESEAASVLAGPEQVYQEALAGKASIKAAQAKVQSAEKQVDVAKSEYWPTLSLSAGISTGYFAVSGQDGDSFADQLDQNLDKSISLGLSIPIFNRFSTRNGVRSAKMNCTSTQIDLDNERKTLYKEVQQAYYNAVAAEAAYASSSSAAESADEAYKLAEAKYAQGLASATDFAEARTNRSSAISNNIKYKYEMVFRTKILDFYRGVDIE